MIWRGVDDRVAPILVPQVQKVLQTKFNVRHYRNASMSLHMYTDSCHWQAFAKFAFELAFQHDGMDPY